MDSLSDFIKRWITEQCGHTGVSRSSLGRRFGIPQRTMNRIANHGRPSAKNFERMLQDVEFHEAYDEFKASLSRHGASVVKDAEDELLDPRWKSLVERLPDLLSLDEARNLVHSLEDLQYTENLAMALRIVELVSRGADDAERSAFLHGLDWEKEDLARKGGDPFDDAEPATTPATSNSKTG